MKIGILARASSTNTKRWVESLVGAGARVTVLTVDFESIDGSQVLPLASARFSRRLRFLLAPWACRRWLARARPDVLVAYDAGGYGMLGVLSGFRPLVVATAGSDVIVRAPRFWSGLPRRISLKRADLVVAWAEHVAEAIRVHGVEAERILVQPRGIPAEEFLAARIAKPVDDAAVRFVSTRSLVSYYRTDLLIESFARVAAIHPNWRLTLVGDGPARGALEEQSRRLGLADRVSFLGTIPNSRLPDLLHEHHGYVSLVPTDGVSASLLEAMAAGLTPVVQDNSANRAWIDPDENGLLVDGGNPERVASALEIAGCALPLRCRCWERNPDVVRRRANMSTNAKAFLSRFAQLTEGS